MGHRINDLLNARLAQIYKASQCTDLADVNNALEEAKELRASYPESKVLFRRILSLHHKKDKLQGLGRT